MLVKDIMTHGCECIAPDNTLEQAAHKMRSLNVGTLPVCDDEHLAGMITDRDIVVRAVAEGRDAKRTRVRDIMTPDLMYCFEDQDVEEATRLMKSEQIRRLPVLNRDKRLVGILSLGDVAVTVGNTQLTGDTLGRISEPSAVGA